MSKIHCVFIKLKSIFKTQSVIEILFEIFLHFFSILIHKILYFFSCSLPTNFIFKTFLLRENTYFHTCLVKRIWLWKINDVELDSVVFLCVLDSEEKPLSMSFCVQIILKNQVVLIIRYFSSDIQVTTLKSRFKY